MSLVDNFGRFVNLISQERVSDLSTVAILENSVPCRRLELLVFSI